MRRTLLSVLVAVVSFVVTAFVLVIGFTLVAGHSTGPSQGYRQPKAAQPTQPSTKPDATPRTSHEPRTSSAPARSTPSSAAPRTTSDEPVPTVRPNPTAGLLSQDFRTLGLDDPSTPLIDESLRSACDVVDGVIAGPALCAAP